MQKIIFLATIVVTICCSCSILSREPYLERSRYDLNALTTISKGDTSSDISIKEFNNLTPVSRQMFVIDANEKVNKLPRQEWIQTPALMLQRLLIARLVGVQTKQKIELNGEIWDFSLNIDKKLAKLGVNYQIVCYVNRREDKVFRGTIKTQAPLLESNGAAAAKAMSVCANELADKLIVLIKNIENEKE